MDNNRNDLAGDIGEEQVPEDDRIIGKALRLSAAVFLGVLTVGLATWWLTSRPEARVVVQDADVTPAQSLTEVLERVPPTVEFTDITATAGINFKHTSGATGDRLLPETMGGGVAFFDFNNDGTQDLLFIDSRSWSWDSDRVAGGAPVLYANDGTGSFTDVSDEVGLADLSLYGMGVAVADVNADGFRDLFITAVGENRLLINEAGQRFVDATAAYGLAGDAADWSTSATFFDADNDGDLDLFVCNYVTWSREIDERVDYRLTGVGRAYGPPTDYAGSFNRLYRNDGDMFSDISDQAGIKVRNPATDLPAAKSLAVLAEDINGDGYTDLIGANDTVQNFYFENQGDGHFVESGMQTGLAFDNTGNATGAMGIDSVSLTDADQVAIAVGNFANEMTSFYVSQRSDALFTDQSVISGVGPGSRQALSFGLFFFDYDLDGRQDLLQTNGHVEDEINIVQPSQHYEQPTQLFWNCGPNCARRFIQVDETATGDLSRPVVGRGAAYADIDGDGDLDVVITQVNRRPLLLRNDQNLGNHYLRVVLKGPAGNPDALGAQVTIEADGKTQRRTVTASRSYLANVETVITFGLGEAQSIDALTVTWPNGARLEQQDIAADQTLTLTYSVQ